MNNKNLFLGIDLGTSGIKIALLNNNKELVYKASKEYSNCLESCIDWEECTKSIINEIPSKYKRNIAACSIDGTSGTLTACSKEGKPFGKAIAYYNN